MDWNTLLNLRFGGGSIGADHEGSTSSSCWTAGEDRGLGGYACWCGNKYWSYCWCFLFVSALLLAIWIRLFRAKTESPAVAAASQSAMTSSHGDGPSPSGPGKKNKKRRGKKPTPASPPLSKFGRPRANTANTATSTSGGAGDRNSNNNDAAPVGGGANRFLAFGRARASTAHSGGAVPPWETYKTSSWGGKSAAETDDFYYDDADDYMLLRPPAPSGRGQQGRYRYSERQADVLRQIRYYGPSRQRLTYKAWSPPTSWSEASREVLPRNPHLPLERTIELTVGTRSTIDIHPPSYSGQQQRQKSKDLVAFGEDISLLPQSLGAGAAALILPISDVSLHVERADGGVLNLYVKDSTRDEWMEYTFTSAHHAAQFQCDLLALQLFGESVYNMYQALQLVHQGSIACRGREHVLNDEDALRSRWQGCDDEEKVGSGDDRKTADEDEDGSVLFPSGTGVAWDDVMRCLGGVFPGIRVKLETLLWLVSASGSIAVEPLQGKRHVKRNKTGSKSDLAAAERDEDNKKLRAQDTYSLTGDYVDKRLMLGPIDFFRLFVSPLPGDAILQSASSRMRVEQLMRWSKRVARASVLVQSYANAMRVVNRGWRLHQPLPVTYWTRRLAFDSSVDNTLWDADKAKNQYYEGTVSRDVVCLVRGAETLRQLPWWRKLFLDQSAVREPVMSHMQGFSLVGMHTFRIEGDIDSSPFRPGNDPVLALPSLRSLIESNPDLEFHVSCLHPGYNNLVNVSVFVRSLPRGTDPSFDKVVDNFKNGDSELRNRKLEVLVQLGVHESSLTWTTWFVVIMVAIVSQIWFPGAPPQKMSSRSRAHLPAIRIAKCGDQYHFGGALQADGSNLPQNYVSHVLYIKARRNLQLAMRLLLTYLAKGGISQEVIDFTTVLAGHEPAEFPERALGTFRIVRALPRDFALSESYIAPLPKKGTHAITRPLSDSERAGGSYFRTFVSDPFMNAITPPLRTIARRQHPQRRNTEAEIEDFISGRSEKRQRKDAYTRAVVTSDAFEEAVNELIAILEVVDVPLRCDQLRARPDEAVLSTPQYVVSAARQRDLIVKVPILSRVNRGDILRHFVAAGCSHKRAAVRLVESVSWHGLTFPLDTRVCRIELQNGQFFQQGVDKEGHPVCYFRNMCLGPWRGDEEAVVAAVLHRLESSLNEFKTDWPDVRCTLVVMMGKPHKRRKKNKKVEEDGEGVTKHQNSSGGNTDDGNKVEAAESGDDDGEDGGGIDCGEDGDAEDESNVGFTNNPRIDPQEQWQAHTNKSTVLRLIQILMDYYPERLHRAFVVVGHGNTAYTRTVVGGMVNLSKYVPSSRTRDKVRFLLHYSDLREYIDKDELVTIASGRAPVSPDVFKCV